MKKDRGEKRTYTIIPATVQVMEKSIRQPLGRQAQQGQHVMGKYMYKLAQEQLDPLTPWLATTGITKTCRDSKELGHIIYLLGKARIQFEIFLDDNPDYNMTSLMTAICTEPVYKDQVTGILDYLPLWPGEQR